MEKIMQGQALLLGEIQLAGFELVSNKGASF